jgi:hypothetical protein
VIIKPYAVWFARWDDEEGKGWQPVFDTGAGIFYALDIWYEKLEHCLGEIEEICSKTHVTEKYYDRHVLRDW